MDYDPFQTVASKSEQSKLKQELDRCIERAITLSNNPGYRAAMDALVKRQEMERWKLTQEWYKKGEDQ